MSLAGARHSCRTLAETMLTLSLSSTNLPSSLWSSCAAMRCSSTCTSSAHCSAGSRSSMICRRTSISNAPSGTNSAGRGPAALRMVVRYSSMEMPAVGLMAASFLRNTSSKMYLMRAPPCRPDEATVVLLPCTMSLKSRQNLFSTCSSSHFLSATVPPGASPRSMSSLCAACNLVCTSALILGNSSRMCLFSSLLQVWARYSVPLLSAMAE
mmetsp:Transcript_16423/g.64089  ORF Transcript_16423/g.64089 Transcript_16423/m.64089 type:complete len:211 (+) Transcript_16423:640-1272(+)